MGVNVNIEQQNRWLESLDVSGSYASMLECLPGVSFFLKNKEGVLMGGNKNFLVRFGLRDESELIGKSDSDLFPANLVESFKKDDQEIMLTGEAKLNIIELFFNRQGLPDWYITNKFPLKNKSGEIVGVIGTTWSHGGSTEKTDDFSRISPAIEHIRAHYKGKVLVEELASMTGLSTRQFGRLFQDAFGTTAQQFIMKTRVQAACEALRKGERDLANLAVNLGFYDQSSFTQHFKKHMKMTPLQYRKKNFEKS